MHRGGGVCVEGPAADSLPKVSPRIRALQDRLLDSLPADGAWECLSPAQREAIISLHRARLTHTFITGNDAPDSTKPAKRKRHANNKAKPIPKGINGYRRSRSYEDKLESETDDSGVRIAGGGNGERDTNSSSTSNSQNSHEDDSSDPGVKRSSGGGRFAKSMSADRLARTKDGPTRISASQPATDVARTPKRKGVVTNGVGNVNKIISKQLHSRSTSHQSTSNVTLDCRNIQGERRRTRIDTDASLFETRTQQQHKLRRYQDGTVAKPQEAVISRRNILQRYQDSSPPSPPTHEALKGGKESPSSEGYDSGINFRFDGGGITSEGATHDQSLQSRGSQELTGREKHDFGLYFEFDRPLQSDSTTPSPCSPTRKEGVRRGRGLSLEKETPKSCSRTALGMDDLPEGVAEYKERDIGKIKPIGPFLRNGGDRRSEAILLPSAVLKKNKKAKGKSKLESNFDYRTHLNQETVTNKYSSNWNSIILSKELPIKSYILENVHNATLYRTSVAPHGRSVGNLVLASSRSGNDSGDRAKPEDEIGETQIFGSETGTVGKKFLRSKSLDRKYLEDSSDDESDFELRRRTERMIRYAKSSGVEWDDRKPVLPCVAGGLDGSSSMGEQFIFNPLPDYPLYNDCIEPRDMSRPKAKSAWDISLGGKNDPDIPGEDSERILSNGNSCFRSRNTILNRWKSEESELASRGRPQGVSANPGGTNFDTRKNAFNQELSRSRWRRRSYDNELDASDVEDEVAGAGSPHAEMPSFSQFENQSMGKEWQRRSCDVELELGNNFEANFQECKNHYGEDDSWEQPVQGEMRLDQQRQRLVSYPTGGKQPRRRRGYPTQDSSNGEETKKKKIAERSYVEDISVEDENESSPFPMNDTMGHPLQYQIRPEITGRKWARLEDTQNCGPVSSGHKSNAKGKNGKMPHGFRGKLKFFKSILSL